MPNGTAERDAAVLGLLRRGSATRPHIAEQLSMSKPTVSAAIAALEGAGLVVHDGQRTGATGRSPAVYSLATTARLVAGIDVGGVNTRAAIADLRGEILAEEAQPTQPDRVIDHVTDMVRRLRARTARKLDRRKPTLAAIVLSTPGVTIGHSRVRLAYNVDSGGTLDFSPLATHLKAPLRVENNVNLAAIGEHRLGAARHTDTFVHISVGAGIGLGTIYHGRLLRGHNGAAGEISYLPLGSRPLGEQHDTGNFENTTAAGGLLARAHGKRWSAGPPRDVAQLFAWAADGDATAKRLVADEGMRIGLAVVAARTLIDPELVVLGGGIGRNKLLIEPVEAVCRRLLPVPCPIVTTELADRGSLVGAVVSAADDAWAEIVSPAAPSHSEPSYHPPASRTERKR